MLLNKRKRTKLYDRQRRSENNDWLAGPVEILRSEKKIKKSYLSKKGKFEILLQIKLD